MFIFFYLYFLRQIINWKQNVNSRNKCLMCFSNISTKNKNKSFITIADRFLQIKNFETIIDKDSKFCSTQCIETFREKSLLKFKLINKPPKIDFRLLAHSFLVIHQQYIY